MKSSKKRHRRELNKGITLIALIITIIIMLILAGVTLSMVLGDNGLINKSKQAVKVHDVATIKEALELEKAESYMANGCLNLDDFLEQISECNTPINAVSVGSNTGDSAEIIINGEHKFIVIADGNGDLDIEYVGAGKFGVLTLSSTRGTYTYPTGGSFTVTNNSTGGALSVSSNAPDVATASISGNTITITPGTTAGKARIIVTSAAVGEYAENKAIYTVTVNKADGGLTMSSTSGIYIIGRESCFTVSENTGAISATSNNTSVATISISGNTITVIPKTVGTATITVKSAETGNYKEKTATYTVTVQNSYAVGDSVTVGGYDFYAIGDDGTNVTLLCKSIIGNANWANAKSQASTFGSSLGGTGRLMTKAEATGVAVSYRNIGTTYWLADAYSSDRAYGWRYSDELCDGYKGNIVGIRPVVIISRSSI